MKIQFFMKNGPRIHEKSFSTQKAIKRSSFCSIFNENRMKIIFWLQILALVDMKEGCFNRCYNTIVDRHFTVLCWYIGSNLSDLSNQGRR